LMAASAASLGALTSATASAQITGSQADCPADAAEP